MSGENAKTGLGLTLGIDPEQVLGHVLGVPLGPSARAPSRRCRAAGGRACPRRRPGTSGPGPGSRQGRRACHLPRTRASSRYSRWIAAPSSSSESIRRIPRNRLTPWSTWTTARRAGIRAGPWAADGVRARPSRRSPDPAEQLGIGQHDQARSGVGEPACQVAVVPPEPRLRFPVDVELDLGRDLPDVCLLQEGLRTLTLLGGQHDRRVLGLPPSKRICSGCPTTGVASWKGSSNTARSLFGSHLEDVLAEVLEAIERDHRRWEGAGQLAVAGLRGGQHRRLLLDLADRRQLPGAVQIKDQSTGRQMIDERRQAGFQVGREQLDAGERSSGLELGEVLLPLVADVDPEPVQDVPAAHAGDRGCPAVRAQQDLAAGDDHHARRTHDRTLVLRVVKAQRVDHVAEELGADRRRSAGGKDVEDATAKGELAWRLGQRFAAVAQLDQAGRELHGVGLLLGRQRYGGAPEIVGVHGYPLQGASRGDDENRIHLGQGGEGVQPLRDRLIERRRPVEEGDLDLAEQHRPRAPRQPGPELGQEPFRVGGQEQHRPPGRLGGADQGSGKCRPGRAGQRLHRARPAVRALDPASELGRYQGLPDGRHTSCSSCSQSSRLKRFMARSRPSSTPVRIARAVPRTTCAATSASRPRNPPRTWRTPATLPL